MYKIIEKKILSPGVKQLVIAAPLVARKAQPGEFVIVRVSENGERIPLTIADFDRLRGTITIIFSRGRSVDSSTRRKADRGRCRRFRGPPGKSIPH